jgi:Cd2+/Zn2+-exporting ATPase
MNNLKDEALKAGTNCCDHLHTEADCQCHAEHTATIHHKKGYHVPGHAIDCDCSICHPHEHYCDICGESLENCTCHMPDAAAVKRVYTLNNLTSESCAARMEYKIKELPGVKYATVSFTTKQLRLSAWHQDELLPAIKEICTSIDSNVEVVPRTGEGPFNFVHKTYTIDNIDCAQCAAKIEHAINELPNVTTAQLSYTTKLLKVTVTDDTNLQANLQKVCDDMEEGVVLTERTGAPVLAKELDDKEKSGGILTKVSEEQRSMAEIIFATIIYIASEFSGLVPEEYRFYLLLVAYLILGREILWLALRNLLKGNALDENFLMSIATVGAFATHAYEEAVGVMLFYRLGELFEHRAVEKSRSQIMSAVDMRPEVVNLVVGNEIKVIPAQDANVGDILLVRAGDRIPLDGIVVEGESFLDTAPLTGEPVPVKKGFGDEVLSGCINTNAMLKLRVEKVLAESMVTKILNSVENAASSKPQIDRFITSFARVYTPIIVSIAVLVVLVNGLIYGQWYQGIYTASTFLVISCPCALVLSVPLAFFAGIGAGSKDGILFKGGVVLEALKNVKAVIMDKTGTITKGTFTVQKLKPSTGIEEKELLGICASAEQMSSHPIASSIVAKAREENIALLPVASFLEFSGEGMAAKLASGEVLCGNEKLLARYQVPFDQDNINENGTVVLVAKDRKYLGQIVIGDTIKEDATEAIADMKAKGLMTVMLTGDSESSARRVADQVGIDEVNARLLPQDKLNTLGRIRTNYGSVMFVGDGINDAPVLAGADVGAAMGSGADAAIEAADVVFLNSKLSCVNKAFNIAKETVRISWQNVYFALIVKFAILVAGLAGHASMWAAVFADTGVAALCVLNSIRILYKKI